MEAIPFFGQDWQDFAGLRGSPAKAGEKRILSILLILSNPFSRLVSRCKSQCAVDDDFLAKLRWQNLIRSQQRWEDVTLDLGPQRREEKRFADLRHAAADHDNVRRKQRDGLCNGPAEHLAGVVEHFEGKVVSVARSLRDKLRRHLVELAIGAVQEIGREFLGD